MKKQILLFSVAILACISVNAQWTTRTNSTGSFFNDEITPLNPYNSVYIDTPNDANSYNELSESKLTVVQREFGGQGGAIGRVARFRLNGIGTNEGHYKTLEILNNGYPNGFINGSRYNGSATTQIFSINSNGDFRTIGTGTFSGKLIIGTAKYNPTNSYPAGYKLYVEDGILTEKVKVAVKTTNDWSDYVFSPEYKLKSLTEVEKFVKENKHLPGVPSAEEMVNGGLDVAKMDAKLLEKIEELTLYTIKQQKLIEKQQEMLDALVSEVEKLKK